MVIVELLALGPVKIMQSVEQPMTRLSMRRFNFVATRINLFKVQSMKAFFIRVVSSATLVDSSMTKCVHQLVECQVALTDLSRKAKEEVRHLNQE